MLAMQLAERYGAEIVSADSRQVYRGFDIGTAKPSRDERKLIPHHGIDVAEPTERFSATRWATDARKWIDDIASRGKVAVVVGGTGLYIKALVQPFFDAPVVDTARRDALETELDALPLSELRRWCAVLDTDRAHLGRTQLTRAIETALLSGRQISQLHREQGAAAGPEAANNVDYLVVDPGAPLGDAITRRVDRMFDSGWAEEVRQLAAQLDDDAPAWKASGYRALRSYVRSELDLSSARERVIIETRQYAKRQRTWFRHQLPAAAVTRINPDDPEAGAVVRDWWERSE